METVTLHPRDDGLYELHLPDGEVVLGPDGRGMTLHEAETALEYIEHRKPQTPK